MTQLAQTIILGLLIGGVYALLASGLTLIFGVMDVVNVAQGALIILSAFLTWARGYDEPSFQGRSRRGHEDWLATLTCPILRLDSSLPREALRDEVLAWAPTSY